jgi:3-dehydroquinate synthase II
VSRDRIAIAPTDVAPEGRAELLDRAHRRGFRRFLVAPGETVGAGATEVLERSGQDALTWRHPAGRPDIPIVPVQDPEDVPMATRTGREHGTVAIRWSAERVIPLENILADAHGRYQVWVLIDRLADVPAMLGALEHGADRVVVELAKPEGLDALEATLDRLVDAQVPWELVPVTRIAPAGMGDRVIVDTTSMLRPAEGMLVGSAAAFLIHVASEAVGSRFTRARPFRVNAGAPHSYALLADGTTRYLSELIAGDAVLVAEPNGAPRAVHVGRIKIERRPLVLIEVERAGRRFTLFLQEAETVRVSTETDRVATTHLAAGAKVWGAAFPPGRHMGGVVDETIEER